MKNTLALLLITLLLTSCKDDNSKINNFEGEKYAKNFYDQNDNLVKKDYYDENGEIYFMIDYKDGRIINIKSYSNGELNIDTKIDRNLNAIQKTINKGEVKGFGYGKVTEKGEYVGWWEYYDLQNKILEKIEFLNVGGRESYRNQYVSYKLNGEIDTLKSDFFNIIFIKKNEKEYDCKVDYYSSNKHKILHICIDEEIDSVFSNINELKSKPFRLRNKKNAYYPIIFNKTGKQKIRGYIIERSFENPRDTIKKGSPIDVVENYSFFEKEFIVE